jgi:CheY-like chemotaxis protein
MRVLIVDDNETNRWILQMQAESWGMVPVAVEGGRQALEKLRGGEQFQVAILDVMMPEIDGYELAAQIRTRLTPEQMPIIMLTSVGDRNKDLAALGIAGMLTKPVKSGPLLRAIQSLVHASTVPEKVLPPAAVPANVLGDNCPLRILVAEDNPVNQRVTSLLLQRMAYRPVIVANGLEVLESVRLARYDVILLDIQMPEMDGLEAARRICILHPRPLDRPWLIALTAHAGEDDREECMAAGMDDYLTKPIRSDNLEIALRHAYEQKPAAPAGA